jgi:hypothetical protein
MATGALDSEVPALRLFLLSWRCLSPLPPFP